MAIGLIHLIRQRDIFGTEDVDFENELILSFHCF